jgi:acetoin utilization protein AcuB
MNLASIMTTRVATVEMDDTLRVINAIFCSAGFHHLLVIDNHKLVGIISDRDLHKAISPFFDTAAERPQDVARWSRRAHQIMTRELITVTPETQIKEAVNLLLQHDVSCLPVISSTGQIAGIVTWKDLIRAYMGLQGDIDLKCGCCGTILSTGPAPD